MTQPEDETAPRPSGGGTGSTSAPWERGTGSRAAGESRNPGEGTAGTPSASSEGARTGRGSDSGGATQAVPTGGATEPESPTSRSSSRRGTVVVDAPTSQIRRDALPNDMPDLSESRRSVPGPVDRNGERSTAARAEGRRGETPRGETPRPAPSRGSGRGPRRAALQIKRIDPWSAFKLSLVLSVALFLVWMIAVGVLYLVLDGMGVWERINTTFSDFVTVSDPSSGGALIGPTRVFGVAAVIGLVNVLLLTAIATISAFVYNLSADLAGGVEVTLTERD